MNGGIDSDGAKDVAAIADGGGSGGDAPGHGLVDVFVADGDLEGEFGGGGIVVDGDNAVVGDLVVGGEQVDSNEAVDESAGSGGEGGSSEENGLGWGGRGVEEEMGVVNNVLLHNVFVDAFGVFWLVVLHFGGGVEGVVFDWGVDLGGQNAGGGFVVVVLVGEVVQEPFVGLNVFAAVDGGVNGAMCPVIALLVAGASKCDCSSRIDASRENGAECMGELEPGCFVVVLEVNAQVSDNGGNVGNSNLGGDGSLDRAAESGIDDLGEFGNERGDPFEASGLDGVFNVKLSVVGAINLGAGHHVLEALVEDLSLLGPVSKWGVQQSEGFLAWFFGASSFHFGWFVRKKTQLGAKPLIFYFSGPVGMFVVDGNPRYSYTH